MIHYHGTPITPRSELLLLVGRNFCISFAQTQDLKTCLKIGQSLMFDNGAYTFWTKKKPYSLDTYYNWLSNILVPPHWGVVPDVINGGEEANRQLSKTWPFSKSNAGVVWHTDESLDYLIELTQEWPRICLGSSDKFGVRRKEGKDRVREAFEALYKCGALGNTWIHGMRMMLMVGSDLPFASVDSSDIARNHHQENKNALAMANRWDAVQCGNLIDYTRRNDI